MKKIYEVLQNDEKIVLVATHTIEECRALRAGVTFLSRGQVKFQSADVSAFLDSQFEQKVSVNLGKSKILPDELNDFCKLSKTGISLKEQNEFILEVPANFTVKLWSLLDALQRNRKIKDFEFHIPDLQKLFLDVLK